MSIKIDTATKNFKTTPEGLNEEINTMFSLLKMVFDAFKHNHFTDMKMIKDYIEPIKFNKIQGEKIIDYLRKKCAGFEAEYMKLSNMYNDEFQLPEEEKDK